jgi:RimJ/RimL family protein N-acetyltransferase
VEQSVIELVINFHIRKYKELGMLMKTGAVTLEGERISLIPLNLSQVDELFEAIDSTEIWTYLPCHMEKLEDMTTLVLEALNGMEQGTEVPFVVIDKENNKVVGMTRLQGISVDDRSLEIGYTWYSTKVWRTRVNTECKYLLLNYCFEVLNTKRVQFRVDSRNKRSKQAVLRIGATKEGLFRKDRILYNGYIRDTVFYSIIDEDWSVVKDRLNDLLSEQKHNKTHQLIDLKTSSGTNKV